MSHKTWEKVTTAIFAVVALFHVVRFLQGWGVAVYTYEIPLWWSLVGAALAGFLAWQGYKFISKN